MNWLTTTTTLNQLLKDNTEYQHWNEWNLAELTIYEFEKEISKRITAQCFQAYTHMHIQICIKPDRKYEKNAK